MSAILTPEQKRQSRELAKQFLSSLGKTGSAAKAADRIGIHFKVLSRWYSGEIDLAPERCESIVRFITESKACEQPKLMPISRKLSKLYARLAAQSNVCTP